MRSFFRTSCYTNMVIAEEKTNWQARQVYIQLAKNTRTADAERVYFSGLLRLCPNPRRTQSVLVRSPLDCGDAIFIRYIYQVRFIVHHVLYHGIIPKRKKEIFIYIKNMTEMNNDYIIDPSDVMELSEEAKWISIYFY